MKRKHAAGVSEKPKPPRVLLFDIESSPILADVWEMFETNVVNVHRQTYVLSFSYKLLGSKSVTTYALPDFPLYKKDPHNDKALITKLHEVMSRADIIVGHNSDAFDIKKSNARFVTHGLLPLHPYKTVDTLKIARRHFKFDSNKLDNLGKYLKVGKKLPHTGMHLWVSCMAGDLKAWRTMKRYNAQDVRLLEAVYLKLRAWSPTHPDLRLYESRTGCPSCPSTHIQKRGFDYGRTHKRQSYTCMECGRRFSGEIVKYEK